MSRSSTKQVLRSFWTSENLGPVLLAVSVGLVGGLGAIFFRYMIGVADAAFFSGGGRILPFLGDSYVILLPAVGLVIVAAIVRRWAPEAQGHGVPEVMYAVKKEGGRIRPRVAAVKALASALCIGSGGSVGREGPIVQIGCTFGSTVGQALGLREQRIRLLVACGAAAGIGGTFNAPIAGVIFALEVILGSFAARSFGLVVISSVTSTALCRAVLLDEPAFPLRHVFELASFAELPLYVGLGLLAGLLAVAFVRVLYFLEELIERWTWHYLLKAAIGGLVVGGLGYLALDTLVGPDLFPAGEGRLLFGVGYDGIEAALRLPKSESLGLAVGSGMTITVLALLVVMKLLATSMSLAAGGSGGVFAPSIFLGAMLGGAFGLLANALFPQFTAPPGAYALVGMGALFAGTAHAPITSVLILFEMTDDYKIILPLMIAVVISHLVSSHLSPDSIYTIKLRRRGGLNGSRSRTSVLDHILVADAMDTDTKTVSLDTPVSVLASEFHGSHRRCFAVLDPDDRLVGVVTEYDVETAVMAGDVDGKVAGDIMTRKLITTTPDRPLREVLRGFSAHDVGNIPVVRSDDPGKLLGFLRRKEIFWAYGQLATEHRRLIEAADLPADQRDSVQVELEVRQEHRQLRFRKVRDIRVPDQCLIVLVRRAGRSVIPRGDTVVEPGDVLVLFTTRTRENRLRRWVEEVTGS